MSRFEKLKRLKDEVNRLFHEGLDEEAVIGRLCTDEQFTNASYEQIQAFYSNLEKKSNAEAENERQITECKQRIVELQQVLGHLQQDPSNERQIKAYQNLIVGSQEQQIAKHEQQIEKHEQQIAEHEEQIAEHERELAEKQQTKTDMEFMPKYQQNASKFLIYDEPFDNLIEFKNFWQKRFLMTVKDSDSTEDVHTVQIQDLFQSVKKSFTIQKVDRFYAIYALKFPFLLLDEFNESNRINYFRLAKFDFESESLQIVQSLEFNGVCHVLISASDASKFLLQKGKDINECKLAGTQIQIGKKLVLDSDFNVDCASYFDEQLCSLKFESLWYYQFGNQRLTQVKMLLCELERNKHLTQDLDSTPENFYCFNPNSPEFSAWMRDTVFIAVRFHLIGNFGVIFTNPQLRNWKTIEFATDLKIDHIQSFMDGSLMIFSEGRRQNERKFYKLQMRKPDSLRNIAWIAMIKLFKEAKIENAYEEARQYLPLNSDIRPFIFIED